LDRAGIADQHSSTRGERSARIRLQRAEETLVLEIEDRGHGIPTASLKQIMRGRGVVGVGIAGMGERIEQLGGRFEITSSHQGTTVRAGFAARGESRLRSDLAQQRVAMAGALKKVI
jgi:signal transduction histidine kinase